MTDPADSRTRYQTRLDDAIARHRAARARAGTLSNLRLLTFGVAIGALVWAELRPEVGAVAFSLFGLGLGAFLVLVVLHSRATERARREEELASVNREALARLDRDWDRLRPVAERAPPGHPYAHDLDIFGHGSVARLFSSTGTGVGRQRLRQWLLEPAAADVIRRRQEGVRELGPRLAFRQDLEVSGRLAGSPSREALDRFLEWAEGEPWLRRRPLLLWAGRAIPVVTLALLLLQLEGPLTRPWWLLSLGLGVAVAALVGRKLHRELDRASLGDASLRQYAGLVERIQAETFGSATLARVHAALTEESDARQELERLGWLTELADLRHGGMFYVLIHAPTLWDFHVLSALESWQVRAGRHVRAWVEAVAEIDALSALAAVPEDEPGWSFPDLDPAADRLEATGLAHPLLAPNERVANGVAVGPPGTFLMVTGSNMSGKSTLLRAIGVNAVLAQAGGAVCAERLRMPPIDVRTSMRVEDSLERGLSLFMAELQQLKRVVDAADAATGRRPILYLLDEILHGTNTAERQVAVREVLSHLLSRNAIGAISTHDLELARPEPLASAVVPVHFQETVHPEGHDPPMTFDYRLREGVATSTNALKLVRLVGLT